MIRAVYRQGVIQLVDRVPSEWQDGQELLVEPAGEIAIDVNDDCWLKELNAAASQIPDRVHNELAEALEQLEAESKELGRREMERSP